MAYGTRENPPRKYLTRTEAGSYSLNMPHVTTVAYDGTAIKDRREYLGYTLADIAGKTGRSIYTLSDIERNRHDKVSKMIIGQIARALEAKPEDFIRTNGDVAA
jgi:hypothetical protein